MAVTEQRYRRARWVVVPIMSVALVGLPLGFRAISPVTEGGFAPAGPGLVQIGLGIALGVLGVVIQLRGIVDAGRVPGADNGSARLPRPVRRAVRRCRDVPEEVRARVPAWLAVQHALCAMVAGTILWSPTVGLVLNADGTVRGLVISVLLTAAALLVLGAPVIGYALLLRRARRHHAPAPA